MTINITADQAAATVIQTLPVSATVPATKTAPAGTAEGNSLPVLNVTKRKSLPTGVASNVKQFCGLLLDTSSSMSLDSKIDELNASVAPFIAELADPRNKDGFRLSIVEFNHVARLVCSAQSAQNLTVPLLNADGGTNFDSPINMIINEIEAYMSAPNPEGWHKLRPHVIMMSDGQASVSDQNIQRLQELADVTAVAYGTDADEGTLSRISSDGQVHIVGVDGSQLRSFLQAVGRTMTDTMAQNI